jgi:hypothetical protein
MKNQIKLTVCCLAALVLTMFSARAQQPPVPACITNVYIACWGDLFPPYAYWGSITQTSWGGCTNVSTFAGMPMISDCTPTNCYGIPLTINPCPDFTCQATDQVIGVLWWQCSHTCDPSDSWHSANIILPAHSSWMDFYVCDSTTADCSLYISCVTKSVPCDRVWDW